MVLAGMSLSACKLETSGLCNFTKKTCIFQDNTARTSELGIPIDSFINRPLNSNTGNEDCRIPQENETFYILIEPCWSNGTATPDDLAECPDIPQEYYEANAIPVQSHDGRIDDSIGMVSGRPVELNILNIGANYMFEGDGKKKADFDSVTRMDKFQFRTIPINDDSWKGMLSQVNSKVTTLARITNKAAVTNMVLDPLSEMYTTGTETMQLVPDTTNGFGSYSSNKQTVFNTTETLYTRKNALASCISQIGKTTRDNQNTVSNEDVPTSGIRETYRFTARPKATPLCPIPSAENDYNCPGYAATAKQMPDGVPQSQYYMYCGVGKMGSEEPPYDPPDDLCAEGCKPRYCGSGGCECTADDDLFITARNAILEYNQRTLNNPGPDNVDPPYQKLVGCHFASLLDVQTSGSSIPALKNMGLSLSPNASFESWVSSGFNPYPLGDAPVPPHGISQTTTIPASLANPDSANLALDNEAWLGLVPRGVMDQSLVKYWQGPPSGADATTTAALKNKQSFMQNNTQWGPFLRDGIGKLAGCKLRTNKYRGSTVEDLYGSESNVPWKDFAGTDLRIPGGTFNFKQPTTPLGEYPINENAINPKEVDDPYSGKRVPIMRYNVSAVNRVQEDYLYNMNECVEFINNASIQKKLVPTTGVFETTSLWTWGTLDQFQSETQSETGSFAQNVRDEAMPQGTYWHLDSMVERIALNILGPTVSGGNEKGGPEKLSEFLYPYRAAVSNSFAKKYPDLMANEKNYVSVNLRDFSENVADSITQEERWTSFLGSHPYQYSSRATPDKNLGPSYGMNVDSFVARFCGNPGSFTDNEINTLKFCYTPDIFSQLRARPLKEDELTKWVEFWTEYYKEFFDGKFKEENIPKKLLQFFALSNKLTAYCYLGLEARLWGSQTWAKDEAGFGASPEIRKDPGGFYAAGSSGLDEKTYDLYTPMAWTYIPREILHIYRTPLIDGNVELKTVDNCQAYAFVNPEFENPSPLTKPLNDKMFDSDRSHLGEASVPENEDDKKKIMPAMAFTSGERKLSDIENGKFYGAYLDPNLSPLRQLSEYLRIQNGIDWLSSKIEGTSVYAQQTANGCLFSEDEESGSAETFELFQHAALLREEIMGEKSPPLPYEPQSDRPSSNTSTHFMMNRIWCLFYQNKINERSYPSVANGMTSQYPSDALPNRSGLSNAEVTPFKRHQTPVIHDYCSYERVTEGQGESLKVTYRKRDMDSCFEANTKATWIEKDTDGTNPPRCLWQDDSSNDFWRRITANTNVIKYRTFEGYNWGKDCDSITEDDSGCCEGDFSQGMVPGELDSIYNIPDINRILEGGKTNPSENNFNIEYSNIDAKFVPTLYGIGGGNLGLVVRPQSCDLFDDPKLECNFARKGSPLHPEESALFSGRCIPNPAAKWDDKHFPPHVNAFVGEGAVARYDDYDQETIVTDDKIADEECTDQCMIYATTNIVTNHYRTSDTSINRLMQKIREDEEDDKNMPYFSGFGLVGRLRQSGATTANSSELTADGVILSENVYENLVQRGFFGSFAPWQELTCPMEVTFGDDRSQSMSFKQQFDNIYVSSVSMVGDIPTTTEALGRGCYMCTKPKMSIYDTLKNVDMWTNHYDDEACSIESIVPTMEAVPYFTGKMDTSKYATHYNDYYTKDDKNNIYDRMQWRDSQLYPGDKGFTEATSDSSTLNNMNFDTMKQYRPYREMEHFSSVAGIYTLYPYVKVPTLSKDADPTKQKRWESLITQQLDYMYNPAWHVTVEVTGMAKSKGRPVLRNFHGRILEENMAEFDVERYAHKDPIDLLNKDNAILNKYSKGLDVVPAMCLQSFFNSQAGTGTVQIKEYDCISDLDTTQTTIKGSKMYEYSIDFDNIVEGQARWMETLLSDTDPILRLIADDKLSGSEDAQDNPAIPFDDRFFVVQRNDGDCEAQLGQVEVEFTLGLMCADIAADIILDDTIDVALGAVMGILLGPEAAPLIAATIGALAGGAQVISESGVLGGTSSFFHTKKHTETFSSCKPANVSAGWKTPAGRKYVKAAFEAMRERVRSNNDLMCTAPDWLHNKVCTACFTRPEEADQSETSFTYNFDWFQLAMIGDKDQCDYEDTYGGNPSERAQCGDYSYEVQLGPLDLGFNKYKRKGESEARYGIMGPPDDMFGDLSCESLADRYCSEDGPFKNDDGYCPPPDIDCDWCAQNSATYDNTKDQCKQRYECICNKLDPSRRQRMYSTYEPTVKVTQMDKPCIFEQPATFFTSYNPASYFGRVGEPSWTTNYDKNTSDLNLLEPFSKGKSRGLQMKNLFLNNDDQCIITPETCGMGINDLNSLCGSGDSQCQQYVCCGGYTSDSPEMWSTQTAWSNPPNTDEPQKEEQTNEAYGYPNVQQKLCYRDLDTPPHHAVVDFSPPGLWEAVRRRDRNTLVERPNVTTELNMASLRKSMESISRNTIRYDAAVLIANLYPELKNNLDKLNTQEYNIYGIPPKTFIDELFSGSNLEISTVSDLKKRLEQDLFTITSAVEKEIEEASRTYDGIGITSWRPINVDKNLHDPYRQITDEINILGVHISSPLFSGTPENQFPGTMVFTSKHKKIHARIVRSLGHQAGTDMGCNVMFLARPNVVVYNMELDNADCQEQILNQLASAGSSAGQDQYLTNSKLYEDALFGLKGWQTAAVRLTKSFADKDPENVMLNDVKITSSLSFRKLFPGRPLISADSQASGLGTVSVNNLILTLINDTHMYRDTRDPGFGDPREQPVPLMPLHGVFWGFKGTINLGHFPDPFDFVLYGSNFTTERLREGTPYKMKNCTGFTEKSLYEDYNNDVVEFNTDCLSTDDTSGLSKCEVVTSPLITVLNSDGTVKLHSDHCTYSKCPNVSKSLFCYEKEYVDVSDVIALDGRDFFDIAADRYACFEAPKLKCTFNYVSNAITIVVGWVVGYIIFRVIFKFADVYSKEPCITITSTLGEQLRLAGMNAVTSEIGSVTMLEDDLYPLGQTEVILEDDWSDSSHEEE